jgi:hypothetical protein
MIRRAGVESVLRLVFSVNYKQGTETSKREAGLRAKPSTLHSCLDLYPSCSLLATYVHKYKSPAALIRISVGVYIIEEPQQESFSFPPPQPVFQTAVTQHASPLFSHSTPVTHANSSLSFDTSLSCLIPSKEKQTQSRKRFMAYFP